MVPSQGLLLTVGYVSKVSVLLDKLGPLNRKISLGKLRLKNRFPLHLGMVDRPDSSTMAQVEKAEIPTSGCEGPSGDGGVAAACLCGAGRKCSGFCFGSTGSGVDCAV
jgi:hypothetical protein